MVTTSEPVRYWLSEISAAKEREKNYRKVGREVRDIYHGDDPDKVPFNIHYSNVETLLPALFSQAPRPVVQRRFKDEDPLGKAASLAGQRMLEYLTDTNVEGYETYSDSMTAAVLDALTPGRGVTSVKYDAETTDEALVWEQVCTDARKWDAVHFGFARSWAKVPWVAFEEYIDRKEAERLFGAEIAAKIKYSEDEQAEDDEDEPSDTADEHEDTGRKVALLYQIWDKAGGKVVRYVSPQYQEGVLKESPDPYGLTGFFPMPRPLQFLVKSADLLPTAPYDLYRNQAEELNNLTRRIRRVTTALKVRGAYDGALGDTIGRLLESDDLDMVPTDEGAVMSQTGGMDRMIWTWPIDKLVVVLQQLVLAREACKRVIYEITGVSDIVRGQSVASETLGAQKIKEAWGTMRLKRMQKEAQRYARDTLRIMLEIAASKLSVSTWAKATGLPFTTAEQRAQAQAIVQAAALTGQQPDPQALAALQAPLWDDVLQVLRNDFQRAYRIDIETNSTIDVDATEDQKNISEMMQAIAQLLHGLGPLVESGTMPFGVAQSILLTVVRRFRFGVEVEDQIKQMQPPKPPDDGAAKAEIAKLQTEQQRAVGEFQQKQQQMQYEQALETAKLQADKELAVISERAESQRRMSELQQEYAAEMAKLDLQRRVEQMKASVQERIEIRKAEIAAASQERIAAINAACAPAGDSTEQEEPPAEERPDVLAPILAVLEQMVEKLTAPRPPVLIERGADGRAVSIGGRHVMRATDGTALGIE